MCNFSEQLIKSVIIYYVFCNYFISVILAFTEKTPGAPCLFLHDAVCEAAMDYTKKKNVFRLHLKDGSEYLFEASNHDEMNSWIATICHQAGRCCYRLPA